MLATTNSETSLSSDAPPRWGWPPGRAGGVSAGLPERGGRVVYVAARLDAVLRRRRSAPEHRAPHPGFAQSWAWDRSVPSGCPLPHLLMLPFVTDDFLWRSGLAGAIPSALCLVIAGTFLFAAVRRELSSTGAGAVAVALFALNPNVLYLASAPMTEAVFFAALAGVLYFTVLFRQTQSLWAAAAAGAAAFAGTLTRYEGWFLIPFVALFFLFAAKRNRLLAALVFGAIASLGPLAWMAHDRWYAADWLSFYRGPYSAKAIQGNYSYPGQGDWKTALLYFAWAARWCAGISLVIIGGVGIIAALARRSFLARCAAEPAGHLLFVEHPFFRHANFRAESLPLVLQHALRPCCFAAGGFLRRGARGPKKQVGPDSHRTYRDRAVALASADRRLDHVERIAGQLEPPAAPGPTKPRHTCALITALETACSHRSAT